MGFGGAGWSIDATLLGQTAHQFQLSLHGIIVVPVSGWQHVRNIAIHTIAIIHNIALSIIHISGDIRGSLNEIPQG